MSGRVIDISSNGLSLSLKRGFLRVMSSNEKISDVPLGDIDTVIVSASGAVISTNLMAALADQGSTIVVSGKNFTPSVMIVNCDGNHAQGRKMRAQADASRPTRKRLWAEIVRAKILAQANALDSINQPAERLKKLAAEVKSGDTTNREAIAAQVYWPRLFSSEFRRNREQPGVNAMLNYGYAVLRSAAARAIVGAGLHPSLSLHHVSNASAFCLADDLMEPFRPAVDLLVLELNLAGSSMEDVETRARLAAVLQADFVTKNGHSPLSVVLVRLAQSLSAVFEGGKSNLVFPKSKLPIVSPSI